MTRRRFAVGAGVGAALALTWVAASADRFVVDGLSMAPGLMPGDVVATGWLPAADHFRQPRRFERWVVETGDGSAAIKRVAGLPGEHVAIHDGDLLVEGVAALKNPALLAEVALPVAAPVAGHPSHARVSPTVVLDDAEFTTEVNRPLEPVADVGILVTIRSGTEGSRVRIACGDARLLWRLPPAGRYRVIAGRLDGRLVAVAWRDREATSDDERLALPHRVPAAWDVAHPWPHGLPGPTETGSTVEVDAGGILERLVVWRDVHHRPGTTGQDAWRLGDDSYLVLGDFPTASVDSRAWGPRPRPALRHRVTRQP